MNKPIYPVITLAIAVVFPCCGGTTEGEQRSTSSDGGGGDPQLGSDAAVVDGGLDGAAANGSYATVEVSSSAGPSQAIDVFFHRATGELVESLPTDNDGKATYALGGSAADSATVVMNEGGPFAWHRFVTVIGFEAGDEIRVSL